MSYANSRSLLRRAHAELDAARGPARDQFISAHMAALKGAAAAIAIGSGPVGSRRKKLRSAWVQLAELGEQWEPWVEFYTASAGTRAALESGQLRSLESDQATQAIRVAGQFLNVVEEFLKEHEQHIPTLARAS